VADEEPRADGVVGSECQCWMQSLQRTSTPYSSRPLRALASPLFRALASPLFYRISIASFMALHAQCHGASGAHGAVEDAERAPPAVPRAACDMQWQVWCVQLATTPCPCARRSSHDVHSLEKPQWRLGWKQLSRPESVATWAKTL
jgi:hypothetical protein